MLLVCFLLNILHYKIWIKGKWIDPGERSSARPYTSVIEKGGFWSPLTTVANLLLYICMYVCMYVCMCTHTHTYMFDLHG